MKSLFVLVLSLFAVLPGFRAATLFDRGANWRWRPGTNEASAPVEAWRSNGFNESSFTAAPAPFWYDTTGDSSTLVGGTPITGMQNVYDSLFLRKTFLVTNLADIAALRLGALVDDGFVAWINGTEVQRVNMAGGPGTAVTVTTLANNAVEPVSFATYDLPAPPAYLVPGTNEIAVQVFQSALSSSDLGFDASLETMVVETNPPTVLSVSPAPGTVTNLTDITVTFSEAVIGVDASDLRVNGAGTAFVTPVNASTYTFTFLQPAYGNVSITWNVGHGIADQAVPPNPFNASGPGATWSYSLVDHTPPLVTSLTPAASAAVRTLSAIIVVFSEPVSGVNAADLLINNVPASSLTPVAANQFMFNFTEPATGTVQVAWAAGHGITDQAASPNAFAGGSWTYLFDPNAGDAPPYLSEFMASNTRTLADETGQFPDWLEIYNPSGLTVNLDGWYLTDSLNNLTKWRFPATNLAGGGFLVVFASGNDRRVPGARLHTSFQLSAGGEHVALVKPDGVTVVSQFGLEGSEFPSQVPDVSYGLAQFANGNLLTAGTNGVYFTKPTPGAANVGGATTPGPVIEEVQHTPTVPRDDQDLLVTARVLPSFFPVAGVTMRYRIMFSNEMTTAMFDDGAHGDGAAGDGVFGATIPANLSTNGQMIRYLIAATDVNANASRWPLFTTTTNHAEYLGTVVDPTNVTSKLPIFQLFIGGANLTSVDTENGGRISLFYDGEFYDNIYMEVRGNTSAGQNKKSHRVEFNREHLFRHLPGYPRVRKTSFMAEFLDPTYIRQHLSFWLLEQMGVPSPFFYPARAQLNGSFYGLVFHSDVIDEEQVARMGYDPAGALYKAAGNCLPSESSTGVFQKKTEPLTDHSDYQALVRAINETNYPPGQSSNLTLRRIAAYDRLDIPEVINYLAGARWCAENDDVWANMSLYRDTTNGSGDGLWRIIPFDMNASWGQRYGGITPLDAINDGCKSHPLYGGSTIIACDGSSYNRIYDVIIALPETRQMLLRRQRTVLDRWVLEPGVAPESRLLETHIRYMTNLIWTEAFLDRAKWGYSTWTASNKPLTNGVNELFNEFINLRRNHFSTTHSIANTSKPIGLTPTSNAGIPLPQPPNAYLRVVSLDFNPTSALQAQEYVCVSNPAPFALDISGWQLEGGVNFTFKEGTVVPSNSVVYVSPDVVAFRARATGPRGGQGLFVVGPSKGQLSARGETLRVRDNLGHTLDTFTYLGAPSPAQQFLRITELMFHPSPHAASTNAEDFEYLELRNISTNTTLSLAGVRLTNGVDFSFTGSAVTSLAPGARVLVVKNLAAFTARYGGGLPVAGQYAGSLDNSGERLQLLDASNEEVLDFSYNNSWYPITDGLGFSLVIVDENAAPDDWSSKAQWRPSGAVGGAPGVSDPSPSVIAPILINEALTRSDVPPPTDSIELFNPTASDANIGGWWLSDDFNTPKKFRIPDGTTITAGGYRVYTETDFNPGGAGFALSSDSDEVWLFSADAAGNLTGYTHGFDFGAAEDGVSFGRHLTSDGREHFVAQISRTPGTANAGPRVGPIVISELMYRPPDFADGSDNSDDEFIELLNITGDPVSLFDPAHPTNTWKITGGVDFVFSTNRVLAPGQFLLLVNFDPTNAVQLAAFRAKYGVGAGVQILGPYDGQLDNGGEDVELKKPTTPLPGNVPFVLVDKVSYRDSAPWPAGADGTGLSLQRRDTAAYGNDPANWLAAPPGAAAATATGGTQPLITTHPQSQTMSAYQAATFNVNANGTAPLHYQWRFNGAAIAGATNSILQLNNVQPAQAGDYDALVFNSAGSAVSSNATLTLIYPPAILVPPQSVQVRVQPDPQAASTTNATFSVTAYSPSPLSYQWRFNGADIVGSTGVVLTLPNVGLSSGGDYSVVVSDGNSAQVSAPGRLYPLVSPSIVLPPLSQSVVVGAPVTFSVSVTGSPLPMTYEWRRGSGVVASNVVNSFFNFYSTNAPSIVSTQAYRVIIKNLAYQGINTNVLFNLITLADADGDGIPDVYEAAYGAGGQLDPMADDDGDGMKNLAEYTAGTDPTNPQSYLKIDSIAAGVGRTLRFGAASNRTYTVEFTDAMGSGLWQKLADVLAQTNAHLEVITDLNSTTNRFYRIATPRQP